MADALYIKRGASLQLLIAITNDDASAFDLTGSVVTSQVRDSRGRLVIDLRLTPTGAVGTLMVSQDTSFWPLGQLTCDLKIVGSGAVLKSETFRINVEPSVTV